MQLKYNNYVAFSHNHGITVNNSGLFMIIIRKVNKGKNFPNSKMSSPDTNTVRLKN